MQQNKYQQILSFVLLFLVFFLSNAPVFIHYIWLIPEVVYAETILWLVVAMVSIWMLNRFSLIPVFLVNLRGNWAFLLFAAYAGFSILWSVYWEISLFRWLVLLCLLITGGFLGLRYTMNKIVHYLSVFGVYILFLSLMFVILFPDLGVMNYYTIHGAWKGIYWHKNHMGFIAALTNTLFLVNLLNAYELKKKLALPWMYLYLFSLYFVYLSDTVGAYITVIFLHGIIILALLLLKYRNILRWTHFLTFGIIVIVGILILFANLDIFFRLLDRSPTLTGRIPMWGHLFDTYFSKKPYLGYGFNAFWYISDFRVAMGLAAGYPDQIVIADNGFIDLLMNTGYVGLTLFLLFYLSTWARSIMYAARAKDMIGYFPVIFMSYTLIANISWSLIFENEGFIMLIMIAVLFSMVDNSPVNRDQQLVDP